MFKGCTFDNQNVTSKNDGGLYGAIFTGDGILWGCSMSVTTDMLTIQPGEMVIGGRLIWVDGAMQIPFTGPIADGYSQVVLTIDLSKTATIDEFEQVEASVVYSTTTTFPALTQGQINSENGDMIYQQELAVVSIAGSNITAITRQIGAAEIDAEKLGGKLPEYYMPKIGGTFIGNVILNANYAFQCIGSGGMYWQLKNNGGNLGAFCDVFEVLNKAGTAFAPIIASRYTLENIGRVGPNGANLGLFANSTYVEILNSTGSAYATVRAAAFPVSSSVRYKNILGMMGREQAKKVLDLEFVKFTYKPEFNDDGGTVHFGAKAEQAHELGMEDIVSYDDEGMPTGIDYSKLTPYLGVVIQEQEKRIEQLKAKSAKLDALSALLVEKGILTQEEIDGLGDSV